MLEGYPPVDSRMQSWKTSKNSASRAQSSLGRSRIDRNLQQVHAVVMFAYGWLRGRYSPIRVRAGPALSVAYIHLEQSAVRNVQVLHALNHRNYPNFELGFTKRMNAR